MLFGQNLLRSLVDFSLQFFEILFISFFLNMLNDVCEIGFLWEKIFHVFDLLLNDSYINFNLFCGLSTFPDAFVNHSKLEIKPFVDNFDDWFFDGMWQFFNSFIEIFDIFIRFSLYIFKWFFGLLWQNFQIFVELLQSIFEIRSIDLYFSVDLVNLWFYFIYLSFGECCFIFVSE